MRRYIVVMLVVLFMLSFASFASAEDTPPVPVIYAQAAKNFTQVMNADAGPMPILAVAAFEQLVKVDWSALLDDLEAE